MKIKPPKGITKYCTLAIVKVDGTHTAYTDFPADGVILGMTNVTLKTVHWITIIPWAQIREITFGLGC